MVGQKKRFDCHTEWRFCISLVVSLMWLYSSIQIDRIGTDQTKVGYYNSKCMYVRVYGCIHTVWEQYSSTIPPQNYGNFDKHGRTDQQHFQLSTTLFYIFNILLHQVLHFIRFRLATFWRFHFRILLVVEATFPRKEINRLNMIPTVLIFVTLCICSIIHGADVSVIQVDHWNAYLWLTHFISE